MVRGCIFPVITFASTEFRKIRHSIAASQESVCIPSKFPGRNAGMEIGTTLKALGYVLLGDSAITIPPMRTMTVFPEPSRNVRCIVNEHGRPPHMPPKSRLGSQKCASQEIVVLCPTATRCLRPVLAVLLGTREKVLILPQPYARPSSGHHHTRQYWEVTISSNPHPSGLTRIPPPSSTPSRGASPSSDAPARTPLLASSGEHLR